MVEINPLGPDGTPSKRRGLILRRVDELKQFREIMLAERLEKVLEAVEKVNPRTQTAGGEEFEV
jgi:hypothetical protein